MSIRVGTELEPTDVELLNASSSQWPRTLTVREIPTVDYSAFVDRSVCIAGTDSTNTVTRAWAASKGTLEFGHDELDPLDELPVLGVGKGLVYQLDVAQELFSQMTVLDKLPCQVNTIASANNEAPHI